MGTTRAPRTHMGTGAHIQQRYADVTRRQVQGEETPRHAEEKYGKQEKWGRNEKSQEWRS